MERRAFMKSALAVGAVGPAVVEAAKGDPWAKKHDSIVNHLGPPIGEFTFNAPLPRTFRIIETVSKTRLVIESDNLMDDLEAVDGAYLLNDRTGERMIVNRVHCAVGNIPEMAGFAKIPPIFEVSVHRHIFPRGCIRPNYAVGDEVLLIGRAMEEA